MTFLAALRCDQITAPCVFDGPINGESFRAYVDQILVPSLRPGDIVIMDNLGSHKSGAIRKAIRAAAARLFFLPPYSPDLNPLRCAMETRPAVPPIFGLRGRRQARAARWLSDSIFTRDSHDLQTASAASGLKLQLAHGQSQMGSLRCSPGARQPRAVVGPKGGKWRASSIPNECARAGLEKRLRIADVGKIEP